MEPDARTHLKAIRHGLLHLHKKLLDWERGVYEQTHGRQSAGDLLKALLEDPHFAWLRPMSQLIVRIDELLEEDGPPPEREFNAVLANLEELTSHRETGHERYEAALQASPDAVFAHRDLVALLQQNR